MEKENNNKLVSWFKKMGWGAFIFFFVKGLVWLAILGGAFKAC